MDFHVSESRQSHTTLAVIERHADDSYSLKALKQKLFVDGLCYLLQEIYGIENKISEITKVAIVCFRVFYKFIVRVGLFCAKLGPTLRSYVHAEYL